jgi:hypothetical protein
VQEEYDCSVILKCCFVASGHSHLTKLETTTCFSQFQKTNSSQSDLSKQHRTRASLEGHQPRVEEGSFLLICRRFDWLAKLYSRQRGQPLSHANLRHEFAYTC